MARRRSSRSFHRLPIAPPAFVVRQHQFAGRGAALHQPHHRIRCRWRAAGAPAAPSTADPVVLPSTRCTTFSTVRVRKNLNAASPPDPSAAPITTQTAIHIGQGRDVLRQVPLRPEMFEFEAAPFLPLVALHPFGKPRTQPTLEVRPSGRSSSSPRLHVIRNVPEHHPACASRAAPRRSGLAIDHQRASGWGVACSCSRRLQHRDA